MFSTLACHVILYFPTNRPLELEIFFQSDPSGNQMFKTVHPHRSQMAGWSMVIPVVRILPTPTLFTHQSQNPSYRAHYMIRECLLLSRDSNVPAESHSVVFLMGKKCFCSWLALQCNADGPVRAHDVLILTQVRLKWVTSGRFRNACVA
jgi:hypothetical protein